MNTPAWRIPRDTDAEREVSRLSLSAILDRQMELEKVIGTCAPESDEQKRARVLLRATYTELQRRYWK